MQVIDCNASDLITLCAGSKMLSELFAGFAENTECQQRRYIVSAELFALIKLISLLEAGCSDVLHITQEAYIAVHSVTD